MKRLIACLEIGAKYGDEASACHDVLYFSGPDSAGGNTAEEKEDIAKLLANGAHWDASCDSWAKFV